MKKKIQTYKPVNLICKVCGKQYIGKGNSKYCSSNCQQKAFYQRKIDKGNVRLLKWYPQNMWSRLENINRIEEHTSMSKTIDYIIEKGLEVYCQDGKKTNTN